MSEIELKNSWKLLRKQQKTTTQYFFAAHCVTGEATYRDIQMFCDPVTCCAQSSKRDTFIHEYTHFIQVLQLNLIHSNTN